jgi:hypothetical protein
MTALEFLGYLFIGVGVVALVTFIFLSPGQRPPKF